MSRGGPVALEPSADALGGGGAVGTARRLLLATRPKFLTASMLPIILGNLWGARLAGLLDVEVFLLCLFGVVFAHSGANVLNDVFDDMSGADVGNDARIHPYSGGSRFIQNGVMSRSAMFAWGASLVAAGLAITAVFAVWKGLPVVYLGVAGVALGVAYSAPPLKLSYRGLGEVCVFAAFGVLPVTGAAWLQSGLWSWEAALLSLPVSFWIAAVLLVNEVPDAQADAAAGKRTLPARLGRPASLSLYRALQGLSAIAALALAVAGILSVWAALVPAFLGIAGVAMASPIANTPLASPAMRRAIEMTLAIHAVGTIWLIIALGFGL
jgi:1,4-dihydroxy-2-naphthoate octaprenyltransferase